MSQLLGRVDPLFKHLEDLERFQTISNEFEAILPRLELEAVEREKNYYDMASGGVYWPDDEDTRACADFALSIPQFHRQSMVISLCSALERALLSTCRMLELDDRCKSCLSSMEETGVRRAQEFMKKNLKLLFAEDSLGVHWNEVTSIQCLRNNFVHSGLGLKDKDLKRLNSSKIWEHLILRDDDCPIVQTRGIDEVLQVHDAFTQELA